jgi:AraC family transcriptional regulator
MKASSLTDYLRRIDRVIAALAASFADDKPMPSVAELARVANFSAFHFMRVYRALAGESLGATLQRLRLERAAHLLARTQESVAEISGRVGFETPQAFARAFRQHFGVAPSEARDTECVQPPRQRADQAGDAAIRVDILELQPFRVVVLRNQGAYADLDVAYGRLFAWMGRQGALESILGIWGIPHHDRRDDAPEMSLFDCCLATGASLTAVDGVTPAELGGGEYLRARHVGSFARLDDAHDAVLRQILRLPGLTLRDAPLLHEYLNDPESTPEAELATHIYVPVNRVPDGQS